MESRRWSHVDDLAFQQSTETVGGMKLPTAPGEPIATLLERAPNGLALGLTGERRHLVEKAFDAFVLDIHRHIASFW